MLFTWCLAAKNSCIVRWMKQNCSSSSNAAFWRSGKRWKRALSSIPRTSFPPRTRFPSLIPSNATFPSFSNFSFTTKGKSSDRKFCGRNVDRGILSYVWNKTLYHINCGIIQRFSALRKAVTTLVEKYRIFPRVNLANQLLNVTRLWRYSVRLLLRFPIERGARQVWRPSFTVKTVMLPLVTPLVSIGNISRCWRHQRSATASSR